MTKVFNYGDRDAAFSMIRRISPLIVFYLRDLVSQNDDLSAQFDIAITGIDQETRSDSPSLVVLSGYVQSAIRQPALSDAGDIDERLEPFFQLSDAVLALSESIERSGYGRWLFRSIELTQAAILISIAKVVTTGLPSSRDMAIKLCNDVSAKFNTIVTALDEISWTFDLDNIDERCFSQTSAYPVLSALMASTIKYILRVSYDLKVEKKFFVKQNTNAVVLAMEYYPKLKFDDAYNLVVSANKLSGDDISFIPSGTQIVVYQ